MAQGEVQLDEEGMEESSDASTGCQKEEKGLQSLRREVVGMDLGVGADPLGEGLKESD